MVALVSLYGLVADPADVTRHVTDLLGPAPGDLKDLVLDQLQGITAQSSGSIGIGLIAGLVAAIWSASSGLQHLLGAINAAYEEEEGRGLRKGRGLALMRKAAEERAVGNSGVTKRMHRWARCT